MPKEQIRKRGKRKPKTEEGADAAAAAAAAAPAPALAARPAPPPRSYAPPAAHGAPQYTAEEEAEAAAAGIHPSRLAFMKTGQRPPAPPRQPPVQREGGEGGGEGGEGGEAGGEDGENGPADWTRGDRTESEFPFGVLDPDVKAYFRNVEEQIKDWEGVGSDGEEREDRQLFLTSVLSELRGHELQVSTDPETSVVLERLLPSLNDWGRRVIGDAVGDNWATLIRHRFGSHVAQTWLTLAAATMDREARGIFPAQHKEQEKNKKDDEGVLPTAGEEVTTLVNGILPTLPLLLSSPHASPPVRLLLLVLTPNRALPSLDAADGTGAGGDLVRSKRSGKFRKGQGVQGKSILGDDDETSKGKGKAAVDEARAVPADVALLRRTIREEAMAKLSSVEWQSMGADKVGSAAVQLLLEAEREDGDAETDGSLLDIVTEGLVAALNADEPPAEKPYLSAMLVSPTGTRLFEAVLKLAPARVSTAVWDTYFTGKLGKLAGHPFANFVVAHGVSRLDSEGVRAVAKEVQSVSGGRGLVKTSRTSVLAALAERAASLDADAQTAVVTLVQSAVDVKDKKDLLVPALMALKTVPFYEAILTGGEMPDEDDDRPAGIVDNSAEAKAAALASRSAWENRRNARPTGKLEPNMQGSLLLQALVGLAAANAPVLDSLFAQPTTTLLTYASSPVASHVLDKVLTTPAVAPKYRRKLYMAFIGSYEKLAVDKLGSRVADTVWATADGFMKEKIARSLIPHATDLGGDRYGRFLARKLDLHLLQRRPDEWRQAHIGIKHHFAHQKEQPAAAAAAAPAAEPKPELTPEEEAAAAKAARKEERRRKRKEAEKDEIDHLFDGKKEKRTKRE